MVPKMAEGADGGELVFLTPMRPVRDYKKRFGGWLLAGQALDLAVAMLLDQQQVIQDVVPRSIRLVFTSDREIGEAASSCGAIPVFTPTAAGLNKILALVRNSARYGVVLTASLPLITAVDLKALTAAAESTEVVVVPDHRSDRWNAAAIRLAKWPPLQQCAPDLWSQLHGLRGSGLVPASLHLLSMMQSIDGAADLLGLAASNDALVHQRRVGAFARQAAGLQAWMPMC